MYRVILYCTMLCYVVLGYTMLYYVMQSSRIITMHELGYGKSSSSPASKEGRQMVLNTAHIYPMWRTLLGILDSWTLCFPHVSPAGVPCQLRIVDSMFQVMFPCSIIKRYGYEYDMVGLTQHQRHKKRPQRQRSKMPQPQVLFFKRDEENDEEDEDESNNMSENTSTNINKHQTSTHIHKHPQTTKPNNHEKHKGMREFQATCSMPGFQAPPHPLAVIVLWRTHGRRDESLEFPGVFFLLTSLLGISWGEDDHHFVWRIPSFCWQMMHGWWRIREGIQCRRPATSSLWKTDSDAEFCQRTRRGPCVSWIVCRDCGCQNVQRCWAQHQDVGALTPWLEPMKVINVSDTSDMLIREIVYYLRCPPGALLGFSPWWRG